MTTSTNQLTRLTNQYNNLLSKYQSVYQEYIDSLNNNTGNSLTTIPSSAFWGTSSLSESQTSTANDCLNNCSANTSCSGATFDSTGSNCFIRSGRGDVTKSSSNQTAIVPNSLNYSYQLQMLNTQLLQVNQLITDTINQSYTKYQQTQNQNNDESQTLQQNYVVLLNEKAQINRMINEYEILNEAQNVSNSNVTQYYYRYIMLLIITSILIYVLFKSYTGDSDIKGMILVISILLFILTFILHYINIYVFFFLLIASYLIFR
jgi:hypothetical protein